MRIQIYPQASEINPEESRKVRDFLVKSFKHETANWPDAVHCSIFIDGVTMRIVKGSNYQIFGKDIYVGHSASEMPPAWVPGVLMAIMFYFRLETDTELVKLSIDLLGRILADAIKPYQRLLVENFNGVEIGELAIDSETKMILAKRPSPVPGEAPRWVATNGEEIELGASHYIFPVPQGR